MAKVRVIEIDDDAVLLLQGEMYGDNWIDLQLAETFLDATVKVLKGTNVKAVYLPKEIEVSILNIKK